jgi:hypothetical protein
MADKKQVPSFEGRKVTKSVGLKTPYKDVAVPKKSC